MSQQNIFGLVFSGDGYESSCKENGFTYWSGRELMSMLGYESWISFSKAINKAVQTLVTLNISVMDNICQTDCIIDNKKEFDYKLSRFGCYLVAMNADNKKQSVAQAQAYFANLAGAVQNYISEVENVERLNIRGEVSERERSLSGTAFSAGIQNYGFFQNAGYRGMYNRNMTNLKTIRGIDKSKSLLDFMGKEELAANLFRITQTELKIKNDNITGQGRLEATAENVGKQVRKSMIEISGVAPENLPKHEDIKDVKKKIKASAKEITKIDKKKK